MRSGDGQRAHRGSRTEGQGAGAGAAILGVQGRPESALRRPARPRPRARREAGDVVPAGVLRGAAAAAPLAVKAAPLSRDCAAANAAGGRSEGDTVAPRRKLGLPQSGPRRRRPGCPLRLCLPRRPPPTPTCSGGATGVEGTTIPRGELSRTAPAGTGREGAGGQRVRQYTGQPQRRGPGNGGGGATAPARPGWARPRASRQGGAPQHVGSRAPPPPPG